MTVPDPAAPGKPRRLGLYAPFALVGLAAVGWCAAWFVVAGQTQQRLDAARDGLNRQGWRIAWSRTAVSGFPFRLDLDVTGLSMREPGGWTLATRLLKAEAWVYAPDHWIIVAPDPLEIGRPRDGAMTVTAKALRASLSDLGAAPPRLSVQGLSLTFTAAPGARPYFLSSAREFDLHTRAGPSDQGAARLELDAARPDSASVLGRIVGEKPIDLVIDGIFDHASAFYGRAWALGAQRWRDAAGTFAVRRLRIGAGDITIDTRSGRLGLDPYGRLMGALDLEAARPQATLQAIHSAGAIGDGAAQAVSVVLAAAARGAAARVPLVFQAGRMTLGPVSLGPAPQVF